MYNFWKHHVFAQQKIPALCRTNVPVNAGRPGAVPKAVPPMFPTVGAIAAAAPFATDGATAPATGGTVAGAGCPLLVKDRISAASAHA